VPEFCWKGLGGLKEGFWGRKICAGVGGLCTVCWNRGGNVQTFLQGRKNYRDPEAGWRKEALFRGRILCFAKGGLPLAVIATKKEETEPDVFVKNKGLSGMHLRMRVD